MKNHVCVMVLAVLAGVAFGQWEPDQQLTDNPAESFLCGQRCIVAGGDTLHAIFVDDRTDTFEVYHARSLDAGATWDSAARLSFTEPGDIFYAAIAAAGQNVWVAWETYSAGVLKHRRSTDAGVTWTPEESLVTSSRGCGSPFLAAEGNNVSIVWGDSRDGNYNGELYYKQSTDAGASWTPDTRLTTDLDSMLDKEAAVVLSGGNRYVVWTRQSWSTYVPSVWFMRSTDNGLTWQPRQRLADDTTVQNQPALAVVGPNLHACWWDGRAGEYGIHYRRSTNGGADWGAEQYLADTLYGTDYPDIAAAGGNVYLVYRAWPGGQFVFDYRVSTDNGATWAAETALTTAAGMGTAVIAAAGNRAHLLFCDNRSGNSEIYHKRNLTAGSVEETPGDSPRAPSRGPTIVRGVLNLQPDACDLQSDISLLDATGRRILDLRPGPNDVSSLVPGVYFVRTAAGISRFTIAR